MSAGPRERLINTAIELVREQGVHATGLSALLNRSKTSRNSLYQHFPSGKGELVETSTRLAGAAVGAAIDALLAAGTPTQWLDDVIGYWKASMVASSFAAGCPIMGAALAESEPAVQAAAGEAYADWNARVAKALSSGGLSPELAESYSGFALSAIDGAIIRARAMKSVQPLEDVRVHLSALLDHYLRAG